MNTNNISLEEVIESYKKSQDLMIRNKILIIVDTDFYDDLVKKTLGYLSVVPEIHTLHGIPLYKYPLNRAYQMAAKFFREDKADKINIITRGEITVLERKSFLKAITTKPCVIVTPTGETMWEQYYINNR